MYFVLCGICSAGSDRSHTQEFGEVLKALGRAPNCPVLAPISSRVTTAFLLHPIPLFLKTQRETGEEEGARNN